MINKREDFFALAVRSLVNNVAFSTAGNQITTWDSEVERPSQQAIDKKIDELIAIEESLNAKTMIRNDIAKIAGDESSQLGTTTDATHLLLYAFSKQTVALNKATSLADVRQAAAEFNDIAVGFLEQVDSGDVKLPFLNKGINNTLTDIEQRATAVDSVLSSS